MRKYKEKTCVKCGTMYLPTGQCSKYCDNCKPIAHKEHQKRGRDAYYKRQGVNVGSGSGSATGIGEKNHMYLHGKCVFDRWARERLQELGCCERCKTPLSREKRGSWAGHHKDHNPYNNVIENLELLCRKCHAIEHECWKAFEKCNDYPERE